MFERKAFGGELDLSELEDFFHESDLHPSTAEIDEAIDVVFCGMSYVLCFVSYSKHTLREVFPGQHLENVANLNKVM